MDRVASLRRGLEEADRVAGELGMRVARVSPWSPVEVGMERKVVAATMSPEVYMGEGVRVGEYLGVVSLRDRRLVLARVVGVGREAAPGAGGSLSYEPDVADLGMLLTNVTVELELLTECVGALESCAPAPARSPVEPLSPVFRPRGEAGGRFLAALLGLPRSGLMLGTLFASGIDYPVEVRLEVPVAFEHVLVVGTTGSGKTVLLKNLALSFAWDAEGGFVAFDTRGDFLHLALPPDHGEPKVYRPLRRLGILLPVTPKVVEEVELRAVEHLTSIEGEESSLVEASRRGYLEAVACGFAYLLEGELGRRPDRCEAVGEELDSGSFLLRKVVADFGDVEVEVYPWSLSMRDVVDDFPEVMPVLSEKVRMLFGRVAAVLRQKVKPLTLEGVLEGWGRLEGELQAALKLHPTQLENLARAFYSAMSTGLFDSRVVRGLMDLEVRFSEPDYGEVAQGYTVAYLRWLMQDPLAMSIVAYRVLQQMYRAREAGRFRKPLLVMVDEAHEYFPQSREEYSKDLVESVINRVTRLGRVHRIGVVFATHSPADLNQLILQLANTKVAFRSEREVLKALGLERFAGELEYAESGVAVAKSYAFRSHAVTFRGLPPQTRHRSHRL